MNYILYDRAAGLLAALCMASGIMLIVAASLRQDAWQELSRSRSIDNAYVLGAVREHSEETEADTVPARVRTGKPTEEPVRPLVWDDLSPYSPELTLRHGGFRFFHCIAGMPELEQEAGTVLGPSGKETWYNLDMTGVIDNLRAAGIEGEYRVREDGVKTYGDYIMCAADFELRPFGTILETSLGKAIVCDTGDFIAENPYQLDIAVAWR